MSSSTETTPLILYSNMALNNLPNCLSDNFEIGLKKDLYIMNESFPIYQRTKMAYLRLVAPTPAVRDSAYRCGSDVEPASALLS